MCAYYFVIRFFYSGDGWYDNRSNKTQHKSKGRTHNCRQVYICFNSYTVSKKADYHIRLYPDICLYPNSWFLVGLPFMEAMALS